MVAMNDEREKRKMVAITELCETKSAAEIAGVKRVTMQNRIHDGILIPVIGCDGRRGIPQYFTQCQVLALTKHEELRRIGRTDEEALAVLKVILKFETAAEIDRLVAEGRQYIVILEGRCSEQPLTLDEVREHMADANRLAEVLVPIEQRKHALAVACVCDFGTTWKALKPLLMERAAVQPKPR